MVYAIIAAVAVVIAVIAFITGLVKGFSRTKTWATEYAFAAAISILIFYIADTSGMNEWAAFALKIGVPAALIIVFSILSDRFKAAAVRGVERAQKRSYYLQYGDIEQNKLEILDSVELGDKRAYNRLSKRKFRLKRGGAGVADRIFGGVTLLIKAAVILGAIALAVFVVLDFTDFSFVEENLGSVYSSGVWIFFKKIVADLLIVAVIFFSLRTGYRSGVLGMVWVVAVIALICGAAYLSFCNLDAYADIAEKLTEWSVLQQADEWLQGTSLADSISVLTIAECIIALAIFLVALILLIIVGIAVGGVISRAREGKTFSVIDGILGAIVAFAIAMAVFLFLGAFLWSVSGSEALETFNSYMFYTGDGSERSAAIASSFYNFNPLNSYGWFENLPFYTTYQAN